MKSICILLAGAALACPECVRIPASNITAGDLAEVNPLFLSLDPATRLGFAPRPGTERVFKAPELALALRHAGIVLDPEMRLSAVCVQRELRPISAIDFKAALVSALGMTGTEIELLDFSGQPLPRGRLEFSRNNLARPSEAAPLAAVVWRGKLVYDEGTSVPAWAKVRISAEQQWQVAGENIPTGAVIQAAQVRTLTSREFPYWSAPVTIASIVGKAARRAIPTGERFTTALLEEPKEIQKGDPVHVKLTQGPARLSLDGVAGSSGRKGDTIWVHNPSSGRNFRARIVDKGEVVAEPLRGV